MDPRSLETSQQRLLALQQQIMQRIFNVETAMLAMDLERDIERTDRVQEKAAEVALTALDEQGRCEMEAIQAALAHIEARTYGLCGTCGETISAARLTAMPTARRCVPCQARREYRSTHA
jgi:DnaK suppressor protein